MTNEEEPQFIDADQQGSSGKAGELSFKQIVLEQIRRIVKLGSCELHAGYVSKIMSPSGTLISEMHNPDEREVLSNSITILADSLMPMFDAQMQKEYFMLEDDLEKHREKANTDSNLNLYKTEKLINRKKLYRALCNFLSRIHFYEGTILSEVG